MIYNYVPLLKTLQNKGITKKQLRETLQLSPATMARISAGEPIATETLGRICDFLQCSLDKIFTIEPAKPPIGNWDRLNYDNEEEAKQTFRLYLYFLFSENNEEPAMYLYGYTMPFIYEETDMEKWYCTYGQGVHKQFCAIDGTLYKTDLRLFLDAATNRKTLFEILQLFKVKIINIKSEDLNRICKARIANGNLVYRPPYILPSETSYLDCNPELKPLLSYTENSTLCESLHGLNKQQFYSAGNSIDTNKIKLLWSYFSENLPLHHNLNEAGRLGNFEVLTPLSETPKQPVTCETWFKDEKPAGAKITINEKLTGTYILRARFFNGRNPISDIATVVNTQDKDDNPVFIPLRESFFFTEIELWSTLDGSVNEKRLIYQNTTPYVRQIALNLSILERSITLEDRWSQAMKQQGQPVNTQVTFFSSNGSNSLLGQQEEPWLTEERTIQKAFHSILGSGKPFHDNDAFFARGTDKILAFLSWLNKLLQSHPRAQRVILFDPYINDTAVIKFIRSIRNVNVNYEIITDSFPAGKKLRVAEINKIKTLATIIPAITTPCKLRVRTFIMPAGTLHDRILIITDSMNTFVYSLSNSLDSMAKQYSSTASALKPAVADEVFASYTQLVKEAERNNVIETLYDSYSPEKNEPSYAKTKESSNANITTAIKEDNDEYSLYTLKAFINDYSSGNVKNALYHLAFMNYEEVRKCFDYVLKLNKEIEIKRLETILTEATTEKLPSVNREAVIYILNQNYLVKQDFDTAGNLVKSAKNAIGWCFEFRSVLPYAYSYAIKLLWRLSPSCFIAYLENLVNKHFINKDNKNENAKPTPEKILIYSMITHIIKDISFPSADDKTLFLLATSKLAYLRALFAAKRIWISDTFLKALNDKDLPDPDILKLTVHETCDTVCKSLTPEEACIVLIHFIENLQVEYCRHKSLTEHIQNLIDTVIEVYIKSMQHNKKSDAGRLIKQLTPLNMRNPGDICQITDKLRTAKYVNTEQSYDILFHFWKLVYTKENGRDNDYYTVETIQRSTLIADTIMHTGNMYTEKLLKEINRQSRNLCSKLYDPLLYAKNYSAWKNAVEQLACLFITERYIVSKNSTFSMGKGEEEYRKLTLNYVEMLEDHSTVYKAWKSCSSLHEII